MADDLGIEPELAEQLVFGVDRPSAVLPGTGAVHPRSWASRMRPVDQNDFASFRLESGNGALPSDPRYLYLDWPLAWEYDGELYVFAALTMPLWRASSYVMGEAIKRAQEKTTTGNLISAVSCGTAVELLTKAFLAYVNPALVAADPISTLLRSGEVEYLPQHPKLRTRMGTDVL